VPTQTVNEAIESDFRAAILRLTAPGPHSLKPPSPNQKLGLAVSGGPDSIALLLLAHSNFAGTVRAATVDHKLRPEAKSEANFVADLCRQLGIPHDILVPDAPITGNIQSSARTTRYALLNQWADEHDIPWLATAHHADDQLETVLMRLNRGSGLSGMSAIRQRNKNIIRPLLGSEKAELVEYVHSHNIIPVDDPSNHSLSFDRVRMRKALSCFKEIDPKSAVKSASALASAEEALNWICQREEAQHVGIAGSAIILQKTDYPYEILRRLFLYCLEQAEPSITPRGPTIEHALNTLIKNGKVNIGNTSCEGGKTWKFDKAKARRAKTDK